MEESTTTIRIKKSSRDILNEYCGRQGIEVLAFVDALTIAMKKQLDLMNPNTKRLLGMVDFYNRDMMPKIILRLSDNLCSSMSELPSSLRQEVYEAFGYKLVDGKLIDMTEKPEKEVKE